MPQPQAQLVITISAAGKVEVTGPIQDKFTCYAMLEAARDAIKDFTDQAAKSQIQVAQPGALPDLSKDRRGSFDAPLNGRM